MSFQQGLSGLNAAAKNLDSIGNNVANSGTVGFKQSQVQFADMYAASLSGAGAGQVGTGVRVSAVVQQFTQGNVTNTSNSMDTAISGQGFFRMVDPSGSILYSRNGQFQVDKNGFLVNSQGHKVSGYLPNAAGVIVPGQPLPIQINYADLSPKQTASVVAGLNLDAREATPINPIFNPVDPSTYNRSTSTTIYDSLGVSHVGALYFQRQPIPALVATGGLTPTTVDVPDITGLAVGNTLILPNGGGAGIPQTVTISAIAPGVAPAGTLTYTPLSAVVGAGDVLVTNAGSPNWNTYMTVDGVVVDGVTVPPPQVAGTPMTQLTFNTLGQLASTTPVSAPLGTITSGSFTPTGATPQTVSFNFASTSQYGGAFGVNTLTQDGYATGRLSKFNTSADGTIMGSYTNGQTRPLGQTLLTNFTNPQGLQPVGNNEWVESATSGGPLIGTPGSSSLGVLQSSAVEDSNVDLTAELVNMITAQRVYQANAQTIKAQDQVLQTLVNLR